MTQGQIQQLHTAVHKAVIIEGKAKTWRSAVRSTENSPRSAYIDIVNPKLEMRGELMGILRQYGFSLLPVPGSIHAEWKAAQ